MPETEPTRKTVVEHTDENPGPREAYVPLPGDGGVLVRKLAARIGDSRRRKRRARKK